MVISDGINALGWVVLLYQREEEPGSRSAWHMISLALRQIAAVPAAVQGLCSKALVLPAFPKAWENTLMKN